MKEMSFRWIKSIEEFKQIAKYWDRAVLSSGDDNPFLLSDFICTWWKHYSKKRELKIFVISIADNIIGGIPLCIEKRFSRNTLVYTGGSAANVTHFFPVDKKLNVIEKLMDALEEDDDWDNLIFHRVLGEHPLVAQIRDFTWSEYSGLNYSVSDNGYDGMVDLSKGYEEVFDNLNKRLKRYIRRGCNEAGRLGELKLCRVKGKLNIRELFKEYVTFSKRSFKIRNSLSVFEDGQFSNFFGELFEIFDEKQMLDAHRLTTGSHTLGISFGYRLGKGFKWILTVYNPEFYKLRPGHLLLNFLIQEAIKNGDPYFDMYYGGELFYKQQWCNIMLPLKRIEIFRRNLFNTSFVYIEKTLRSNKTLINGVRKARNLLNRIKYFNSEK